MHNVKKYLSEGLEKAEDRLRDALAELEEAKQRQADAKEYADRTLKWRDELHAFISSLA